MKRIIALFGYPMDSSIRAEVFNNMPEVWEFATKWKEISYFIVAFETKGEIFLPNYEK